MSAHAEYYSDWKTREVRCTKCEWKGPGSAMSDELFSELLELSCPSCDTRLVLVPFPTADEIVAAARGGHEEAIKDAKRRRLSLGPSSATKPKRAKPQSATTPRKAAATKRTGRKET